MARRARVLLFQALGLAAVLAAACGRRGDPYPLDSIHDQRPAGAGSEAEPGGR